MSEKELNDELLKKYKDLALSNEEKRIALEKNKEMAKPFGWTCPRCGRGLSPWATVCPCLPWGNPYHYPYPSPPYPYYQPIWTTCGY